jgi:outer membrane protein assembly factor BamB
MLKKTPYPTLLLLLLLLAFGCAGEMNESDDGQSWPTFRGNAAMSGAADVALPRQPTLLWSYASGERAAASPVVYRQTVYWCSKRGHIYGLNAEGQLCFEHDFATAVESSPAIRDSVLYLGRIDGLMCALSLASRSTLWTFETMGQISASANFAELNGTEAVVFGSYDNFLYALDRHTGHELSRYESGYYINGAAAVYNGSLLFGGCDAWLRIISVATALPTDSTELGDYIPASPAVADGVAYIADHSGNVHELVLADDGRIASRRKLLDAEGNDASLVSVPAVDSRTLYVLADNRQLYAIDRQSGTVRWTFLQKGDSGESSPVVCHNRVIACTRNGIISIVDASSGALLWEYDAGEPITASPAVVAGRFYVLTAKGRMMCFG